jgi:MFS transporter, DHA3 family, macrolide efflux protein
VVRLATIGFWWLWGSTFVMSTVLSADRFTFEWLVGRVLDAPEWATGVVLFALGAPICALALFAGALADRSDRGRMLQITQLAAAAIVAATALLIFADRMSVWAAVILATLFGTAMAFTSPVRASLLSAIVPKSMLMNAIVLSSIGMNVAMIIGPLIVGWVITGHGIAWAFVIQAGLFLVATVFITRLKIPPSTRINAETTLRTDIREALSFVWNHKTLSWMFFLLIVGSMLMFGSAIALLPKITRDYFDRDADDAASLFALMGVGLIITSAFIVKFRSKLRRRGLTFASCMIFGTANGVIQGQVTSFRTLQVLLVLWGLTGGFYMNLNQSLIQELTPQDRIGRVMSITSIISTGLVPVGALICSALAGVWGARPTTTIVSSFALGCVALTLWLGHDLRAQP